MKTKFIKPTSTLANVDLADSTKDGLLDRLNYNKLQTLVPNTGPVATDATPTSDGLLSASDFVKLRDLTPNADVTPGYVTSTTSGIMRAGDKFNLDTVDGSTVQQYPVGTVIPMHNNSNTNGWLLCDGTNSWSLLHPDSGLIGLFPGNILPIIPNPIYPGYSYYIKY